MREQVAKGNVIWELTSKIIYLGEGTEERRLWVIGGKCDIRCGSRCKGCDTIISCTWN